MCVISMYICSSFCIPIQMNAFRVSSCATDIFYAFHISYNLSRVFSVNNTVAQTFLPRCGRVSPLFSDFVVTYSPLRKCFFRERDKNAGGNVETQNFKERKCKARIQAAFCTNRYFYTWRDHSCLRMFLKNVRTFALSSSRRDCVETISTSVGQFQFRNDRNKVKLIDEIIFLFTRHDPIRGKYSRTLKERKI